MSLNKARILSSENDASVKQEQNTEVKINIVPLRRLFNHPGFGFPASARYLIEWILLRISLIRVMRTK